MLGAHNNKISNINCEPPSLFVQIWSPRSILGMHRYYFWIYLFHSDIPVSFGYIIIDLGIPVSFELGNIIAFSFGYTCFIWVYIPVSFGYILVQ